MDIDLKFFQKNLIPKLHKTLVTSVRQDSSAPLFNLIFAMRVALLQDKISTKENTFFFKQLLLLKDFQDWRKTEKVNVQMRLKKTEDSFWLTLGKSLHSAARINTHTALKTVQVMVTTKLVAGLSALTLTQNDMKKLNDYQNRILKKLLNVRNNSSSKGVNLVCQIQS